MDPDLNFFFGALMTVKIKRIFLKTCHICLNRFNDLLGRYTIEFFVNVL